MSEVGTVKAVNSRGFAFIRPDHNNGGKDIFAHYREFERAGLREPEVGDRFEFTIKMTEKGPQAEDIKPVM
jgi:cold shock protein